MSPKVESGVRRLGYLGNADIGRSQGSDTIWVGYVKYISVEKLERGGSDNLGAGQP